MTSSYSDGNAGNITIDASDFITVGGRLPGLTQSMIASGVSFAPAAYQQLTGVFQTPTGSAGQISISAPHVAVEASGTINVANLGLGDAGTLLIRANAVDINDSGNISALSTSGAKGNMAIASSQSDALSNDFCLTKQRATH